MWVMKCGGGCMGWFWWLMKVCRVFLVVRRVLLLKSLYLRWMCSVGFLCSVVMSVRVLL